MWLIPLVIGVALVLSNTAPFPFLLDWTNGDVALWRARPLSDALPDKPIIYLTFDDGPNPTATPALLDVLARHRVRATFFVIPRHVTSETAPIVERAAREGHGIALHSHTRALVQLTPQDLADTLDADEARIEALAGVDVCPAFRPHGGTRSSGMMAGLRRSGRRLVGWGLFLWDWDWLGRRHADRIVPRLARRVSAGSIVVLHDGHHVNPRADRRYVVETVDRLIPRLRRQGFEFGSVCDVVAAR